MQYHHLCCNVLHGVKNPEKIARPFSPAFSNLVNATVLDLAALEPKKRGPKGNPLTAEVRSLKAKLARAERQLKQANTIIDIQKKISDLLGITTEDSAEEAQ